MRKPSVEQLAAVLELIARHHPSGLCVLTGEDPAPSDVDLAELLASISSLSDIGFRVSGGVEIYQAEKCVSNIISEIIEAVGGWEHIQKVTSDWVEWNPEAWKVVLDHSIRVTTCVPSKLDKPQLEQVADKHGITRKTVWTTVKGFYKSVAQITLRTPVTNKDTT